jgi:hypothetical protein
LVQVRRIRRVQTRVDEDAEQIEQREGEMLVGAEAVANSVEVRTYRFVNSPWTFARSYALYRRLGQGYICCSSDALCLRTYVRSP